MSQANDRVEALWLVSDALIRERVIEPLEEDCESDLETWLGWELASFVEGCYDERLDSSALTAGERRRWSERATKAGVGLSRPSTCCVTGHWLLDGGERVGKLTLGAGWAGGLQYIGSLYVLPARRGTGVATRALQACYRAALRGGCSGVLLRAEWTRQRALRFYAQRSFWVRMWKHEIVLVRARSLPPYRVTVVGDRAAFEIDEGDGWRTLLEAERLDARLGWRESAEYLRRLESWDEMALHAPGTFALNLALRGWPLIRSAKEWEARYESVDGGQPEGLGYKIQVFEAVAVAQGHVVNTPRIPGLDYPSLEELRGE